MDWGIETWMVIIGLALAGLVIRLAVWYGAVNSDRKNFKEFMEEIREDIKAILSRLPPSPVASGSPLHLTEFGEKISKEIGAEHWPEDVAPSLLNKVGGKEPFEIDRFCVDYVERLGPEWNRKIAESSYEFGIKESGIKSVLHVVLRDEILKIVSQKPKQNA